MSEKEDIDAALEEMSFYMIDNGCMELPVSAPGAFSSSVGGELSPDEFDEELDAHDFVTLDTFTQESDEGFYYKTKVMTDHYKDCVVKVWQNEVRIFPREEILDTYELARIVHAVEDAFGMELEHTVLDNDE